MLATPLGSLIRPAALAGFLTLASSLAVWAQDEPAKRAGDAPPAKALTKYVVGAEFCQDCHNSPKKFEKLDNPLCRFVESEIWGDKDKHKKAYAVLLGDRAKRMGELLKIKVTESAACINCHSTPHGDDEGQDFDPMVNGVTCVACHGAAREWIVNHSLPDKTWRKFTRKQKETQFGMTDLWDPVTRATKCASCHIGNADEKKIVTHAMYAAGHPPLPGLEAATFSDAQPRHWQYLREKKTVTQIQLDFNPGKREETDLVVVSGIVALRDAMRLYAAQAAGDGIVKEPETQWPDFARFDCYACHHDLQMPSWRQARGYTAAPGRPPAPTWPSVLVRLGITVADPNGGKGRAEQYKQSVAAFHRAMGDRPFGNRAKAVAAAKALADWADEVSKELRGLVEDPAHVVINGPMATRLLQRLGELGSEPDLDYDSARQIVLAFREIYREGRAIDSKWLNDPAIAEILEGLDKQFVVSLPDAGVQEPIEKTLEKRMKAVADFNPAEFQSRFSQLTKHLPQR